MESKPLPDFSETDNYQVSLKFRTDIRDVPFLVYIRQEQAKRPKHHKLNVLEWVSVDRVRYILSKLETFEMLKREGAGKGTKYRVMKMRGDFDWPATSLVHEHGQRGRRGDCLSMT